jgi:hypothetical protein
MKRSRSNHFLSVCGCVPHRTTAFISQRFKDRMSLIQKLKSAPVINRKQNAYEDMNCIPILHSNTAHHYISYSYYTCSNFHFFGHPQLGLWWKTRHIQENYSFGHTLDTHITKLQFWTHSWHSHNKITVLDTLLTLTQQNYSFGHTLNTHTTKLQFWTQSWHSHNKVTVLDTLNTHTTKLQFWTQSWH